MQNADSDRQIARQLADINFFANEGAQSIRAIHQKIQSDIEKNEALLDLHCDEITQDIAFSLSKDDSMFDVGRSTEIDTLKPINELLQHKSDTQNGAKLPLPLNSKAPRMNSCLPRFNINLANKPLKRNPIDPQKKSKLLAQLKSIESGNGCLWNHYFMQHVKKATKIHTQKYIYFDKNLQRKKNSILFHQHYKKRKNIVQFLNFLMK